MINCRKKLKFQLRDTVRVKKQQQLQSAMTAHFSVEQLG